MNRSRNTTLRLIVLSVFWFVLQFGFAGPVFAKYKPTGSEFQVNTYTNGAQENSSAAPLANGGFVVTWMSDGQDGSGPGVYGQVFGSTGNKVGGEFGVTPTQIMRKGCSQQQACRGVGSW